MAPEKRYTAIDGEDLYRRLAMGEPVVVLDVRTAPEYDARRIPGTLLIPLQQVEERLAEIPNSGMPIAVVSESGQRSVSACRLLAEHGYGPMLHVDGGLEAWPGPVACGSGDSTHHHSILPSSFLIRNFRHLPKGLALDVAMGEGRNAIYMATRGFDVDGVDADVDRVARARAAARKLGAPIRAVVGNLEDGTYIIPLEAYNVIIVFNYLHRPLIKDIKDGVVPGGVVVYQTFTAEQARFGPPRNPDHLLRSGELKFVFADWDILDHRELTAPSREGGSLRAIAGIVARRPH